MTGRQVNPALDTSDGNIHARLPDIHGPPSAIRPPELLAEYEAVLLGPSPMISGGCLIFTGFRRRATICKKKKDHRLSDPFRFFPESVDDVGWDAFTFWRRGSFLSGRIEDEFEEEDEE